MKKLKVGIIGIGAIANYFHLKSFSSNEHTEIAALCDISIDKAERAAKLYGAKITCADYQEIINMDEIDIIDICTPNHLHSVIAVEALNHGKHVICEKPDAINFAEARKMKQASENSGKILMVIRNNRFLNSSRYLKKYVDDGHMGEIYAARCGWERRRGIPGAGGWFTTREKSGGGALIDLGVHMIDLVIWYMGNPEPVSVVGSTYSKFTENTASPDSIHANFGQSVTNGVFDVEDMGRGFVKFANGASLSIEISWASNIFEEKRYYELLGTKAGARYLSSEDKVMISGEIGGKTVDICPHTGEEADGGHKANIDHFIDCIVNSARPIFLPEQGVATMKILDAIYMSANTGREIVF